MSPNDLNFTTAMGRELLHKTFGYWLTTDAIRKRMMKYANPEHRVKPGNEWLFRKEDFCKIYNIPQ